VFIFKGVYDHFLPRRLRTKRDKKSREKREGENREGDGRWDV